MTAAVLFDLDYTLAIDHELEEAVLAELAAARGVSISRDRSLTLLREFQSGKILLGAMLSALFQSESDALAASATSPVPGGMEAVARLRARGIATAIFSK